MAYPLKFLFEGNTSWYVTSGLKIILVVAWKLISERKNKGRIFQEENVVRVGGGRDFPDAYHNACKTVEPLLGSK